MAQFTIALDSKGKKINIEHAERRGKYTCINCGEAMMAKKGQQREWHFSHHNVTEQCNHDKWLHVNILNILMGRLEKSQSLIVEYPDEPINLCENVSYRREREYEGLFPDILIQREGDVIFIEVCVTCPCSKEKIATGHRIIEIVTSDTRVLDELSEGTINSNAKHYKLVFHNFKKQEVLPDVSHTNIPDILSPESDRTTGYGSSRGNMNPIAEDIPFYQEKKPTPKYDIPYCPKVKPFNGSHASFFILHSDKTFEVKGRNDSCPSDLLVLGINTVADFAINIGKSYAWRRGLLPQDVLTEYEQHIDMPAVIQSFNIVEFKE